jgi:predicted AlkP superfamily phosphohydrolase/phosphomutase
MPGPGKVLFIAMDGGDRRLIQEWTANGLLPNLRAFTEKGLVGDVAGLEGFFEGSTWPSFYTGLNPARHGFHSWLQLKSGTYEWQRIDVGRFMSGEPFWIPLSRAGRRVAVLDIPLSGITEVAGGIQTVEWGSHDAVYGFDARPAGLKDEIMARFGPYPVTRTCDSYGPGAKDLKVFRELLLKAVAKKTLLTRYLFGQGPWDFFAQVFTESHCIGHQYWHFRTSPGAGANAPRKAGDRDPVEEVYSAIDSAIGEILADVDEETIVVFLASHGMAHYFGLEFLLPSVLLRLGVAVPAADTGASRSSTLLTALNGALAKAWRQMPGTVKDLLWTTRNRLKERLSTGHVSTSPGFYGLDPERSRCFPLVNGASVCGLRINLAGREPRGIVRPGEEMDALCRQLTEDLAQIVDADTGRPVVKSVMRTDSLYRGERLDDLPDLLVEWNDDRVLSGIHGKGCDGTTVRIQSGKIGVVEGTYKGRRTGDHRKDGFFVAAGPGIKPGCLDHPVSIMDFAPTFLTLLGVEPPPTDGRPIEELLPGR